VAQARFALLRQQDTETAAPAWSLQPKGWAKKFFFGKKKDGADKDEKGSKSIKTGRRTA